MVSEGGIVRLAPGARFFASFAVVSSLAACAAQGQIGGHAEAQGSANQAQVDTSMQAGASGQASGQMAPPPPTSPRPPNNDLSKSPDGIQSPWATGPSPGATPPGMFADPSVADPWGNSAAVTLVSTWALHRVALAADRATRSTCGCVAAAVGPSSDGAFAWASSNEARAHSGGWVVAIAAASCPAAVRPSIAGVERSGDDVIVELESPRIGVPLVRGAMVEPPTAGGAVVLRARPGAKGPAVPLGPASDCRLGGHIGG